LDVILEDIMTRLMSLSVVVIFTATSALTAAPAAKPKEAKKTDAPKQDVLKTKTQKVSYAFGMRMGKGLKMQSVDIDIDVFARAMKDVLADRKLLLTEKEAQEVMMSWQKEMMAERGKRRKEDAVKNKKEGEAFLAANKKKEGIVALPSGLQYKVIKAGTGPKPKATDTVTVNYRGTLINGTEFDSSEKQGKPMSFPVNQVIKGWTEALQLMKVGAKWQLFVPSNLAYMERGGRPPIGPNATLIFDIELLSTGAPVAKPKPKGPPRAMPKPKAPGKPK